MTTDAPTWLDLGPAEFDKSRLPRRRAITEATGDGQGGLFFLARTPKPAKAAQLPPELPGQSDIFDVLEGEAS